MILNSTGNNSQLWKIDSLHSREALSIFVQINPQKYSQYGQGARLKRLMFDPYVIYIVKGNDTNSLAEQILRGQYSCMHDIDFDTASLIKFKFDDFLTLRKNLGLYFSN